MKNRIVSYIKAFEEDKLEEYYEKRGKGYGLRFCPICGFKKLYMLFDYDDTIIKARCFNVNCKFYFNPTNDKRKMHKISFIGGRSDRNFERRKKILLSG